jgi:hypothetical protein
MSEQAISSSLLDTLQKKYKRNNGSIIDEESVNKDESIVTWSSKFTQPS